MGRDQPRPEELLTKALAGDQSALGDLLEHYRQYLTVLARIHVNRQVQAKMGASDLVQEAFLNAHRSFGEFRGQTQSELVAWLRKVLAACVVDYVHRRYARRRRDVRLEERLEADLDKSAQHLRSAVAATHSSPSQIAVRREQVVEFANALERLPKSYRSVILLRHVDGLPFADIAKLMGRSVDSVQKLWIRGLDRLRRELGVANDR